MNKSLNSSRHHSSLTLGDLILVVSSVSRNSTEAAAAISDLLQRGRVRIGHCRRKSRAA
jgi:hypothetical protein